MGDNSLSNIARVDAYFFFSASSRRFFWASCGYLHLVHGRRRAQFVNRKGPGCREYPTSATHRKAPRRCCIAGALASSPAGFGWAGKDRRPLRAARTIWFPHRRKGPGVVGIRGLPRPGAKGGVITTLAGRTKVIAFGSESSRKLKARTVGYPPQSATGLSRLVLAEPASRERLHRSLSRGRKAVHRVTAVTEGKIDRPYPGRAMVSESAEQRDPANDLCVRDHFVLGGTSCRLQE